MISPSSTIRQTKWTRRRPRSRWPASPPDAFEYHLGNRSALEWVIDQYQVSTDNRSGITSEPNRADDEQYIVRLVGQVIRVSVAAVQIVKSLPAAFARPGQAETDVEREPRVRP